MRKLVTLMITAMALGAGADAHAAKPDAGALDFELHDSANKAKDGKAKEGGKAKEAHGATESKLDPTKSEAVIKFFVVDKDKGPVKGIVIALSAGTGKYFTEETDAEGYAEVLVPVGQKYELTYLSLGRKDVAASVTVTNEPKQTVKLTLRYKSLPPPPPFVMTGIVFDTAKSTIRPESTPRLDVLVEFMSHKRSARVEISGHTDNVGKPKANKDLSARRAQACRAYVISKGIDGTRIDAVGYGEERPIAPNTTDEGRQKNRRIEAKEL